MFLLVVLNVFPFTPRYIIPVAGMMVGNAMTVTGVTMKKLREDLKVQKNLVGLLTHLLKFSLPVTMTHLLVHNPYGSFLIVSLDCIKLV